MDWREKYLNKGEPQVGNKVKVIRIDYQDKDRPFKVGDIFTICKIVSQNGYIDNKPYSLYFTETGTKLIIGEFKIIEK